MLDTKWVRRRRATGGGALLLALLAGVGVGRAHATDIVVTTTTDESNSDGDCSLREAVRAAIFNAAKDACPAGESNATDTIILQGGAVYSLTIPGTENASSSGDLDILNGAAATDLVLKAVGGGRAIISQDAFPDDRVIDVMPGAVVELDDIEIRGGAAPAGANGGGLNAGAGSSVTLKRCAFRDNSAADAGGAVALLSGATLSVEDSVFESNVAGSSGGALSISPTASATVAGSLFVANDASGADGGAIVNDGTLTTTSSTFVDNRAHDLGGGVASRTAVAGKTSITASCFIGNEGAVDNAQSAVQTATGNWWGATDGPSGVASGSGDAVGADVTVTGFLTAPPAGCLPLELVANGNMESNDVDLDLPDRWRTRHLVTPDEGLFCTTDGCAVEIDGGVERTQLLQTILLAGSAGDSFTFSARSSAAGVPASGGRYLAELRIVHSDGTTQSRTLKFDPGDHDFVARSKVAVASKDYVRLKLRLEYSRPSGSVRFDDVSVVKEP